MRKRNASPAEAVEPYLGAADAAAGTIESFPYLPAPGEAYVPALSEWTGWSGDEAARCGENGEQAGQAAGAEAGGRRGCREPAPAGMAMQAETAAPQELAGELAGELARAFEAGRERGVGEGRELERAAQAGSAAAASGEMARRMAALVESFSRASAEYLQALEPEVARLALAVAARILRREAQMDPLLLMGAVRVALNQVAAEARLRVPAGDLDLWTEAVGLVPNLSARPRLIPDEALRVGECIIETPMGSAELGLGAQLAEIERSFFAGAGRAPIERKAAAAQARGAGRISERPAAPAGSRDAHDPAGYAGAKPGRGKHRPAPEPESAA